ncbi:DUF6183 family protein [Lentzea sp. NPDC051213]|uniref:DUF6183 family protein n=1 Tax=Lentzea sp. NPDC051213 TaxID=3364126 RepID=UPI00379FFD2F
MVDHRHTASMFASRGAGLSSARSTEERACLMHELVLRGVPVPGGTRGDHPLAWLPLTRSSLEEHVDLPEYEDDGHAIYTRPQGPTGGRTVVAGAQVPVATETACPKHTTAAVDGWTEGSNGCIEARGFEFAEPLDVELLPNVLLSLGLQCTDGETKRFWVADSTPAEVWRTLFAASSLGGACNAGAYGAYGRLAAWRSLAGLVGLEESASAAEVESRAGEWSWYQFDPETCWFEGVDWDLAVVAVSPDRTSLTVLAATDTD